MMVSPLGGFFLVVGASLLTAARAVLSDPNHISCDRSNPKIDSNGSCVLSPPCGSRRPGSPVPQTYLCQAVTGWSLSITCSLCPEPADWFRNATQKLSDKPSKTLTLNATEVSPGCYTCQCRDYTCEEDMAFYVAVEPGSKPEFNASCDTDPYNSTQCYFHPSRETVSLHRNESGIICLDGQATAYPVPQYRWEYEDQHGVLHSIGTDLCLNHKDGSDNSTLCITPSLKNTSTRKYRCVVWNEVGTMVGVRNIKLNIRDWVLHDHPDMTSGTVYLINGSATGKMAVYDDCSDQSCYITYASCLLEEDNKDIAEHKDLSCYLSHPNKIKDLYMSCCSCESTCTGYAKTFHSLNIPGDGIASSSECSFSTATPGVVVFMAFRSVSSASSQTDAAVPVYQYLGEVTVKRHVPCVGLQVLLPSVLATFLVGVAVIFLTCFVCQLRQRCCKPKRVLAAGYEPLPGQGNQTVPTAKITQEGTEDVVVVNGNIELQNGKFSVDWLPHWERARGPYRANGRCSVDVTVGRTVLSVPLPQHNPAPEATMVFGSGQGRWNIPNECIRQNKENEFSVNIQQAMLCSGAPICYPNVMEISVAGVIYGIQMPGNDDLDELTRSVTVAAEGIREEMRKMTPDLIKNLNIDAVLLGIMKAIGMLNQTDHENLSAMVTREDARNLVVNKFLTDVVFRWAPSICKSQLKLLAQALSAHDDQSNLFYAGQFKVILGKYSTTPFHSLSQ